MCGGKPAKKGGEFLRVLTDNYPDDGYKVPITGEEKYINVV